MVLLHVTGLPDQALAAAAAFHADWLERAREVLAAGKDLTLIFPAADYTHRTWRLAMAQGLAREYAPLRVNILASFDLAAIASAERYLAAAPGLTGQYLTLDGAGAGPVVSFAT